MAGILIGVVLLVVAGALYFFAGRAKSRGAGLAAAPTVPVKDLGSVGPMLVEVVGTAVAAGPTLTSPIGGQPCVWFRSTVHELYRERVGTGQNARTQNKERLVSDDTSPNPIVIDDGTGTVTVDLDGCDVDRPVLALDRRIDDDDSLGEELLKGLLNPRGDDAYGYRQREHIIAAGQRLFAIGVVTVGTDGPRLTKPTEKGQPFLVSTRDEAQLQRSAASSSRWLTVGAVVAGVAGVAAVIAGALS